MPQESTINFNEDGPPLKRPPPLYWQMYECNTGGHHKFWYVAQNGQEIHLQWGRIGTTGQRLTKVFTSVFAATKKVEKMICSKHEKGYKCVGANYFPGNTAGS